MTQPGEVTLDIGRDPKIIVKFQDQKIMGEMNGFEMAELAFAVVVILLSRPNCYL